MKISKIDAYRNDLSRVIVYFEDRSYITVDALKAEKLGLKTGMELDAASVSSLSEQSARSAARAAAARIVGRNSMSCMTLLKKLREKGVADDDAKEALNWLIDLGIMDDRQYGQILLAHYRSRGFGNRRIREEMRNRGIQREDIDALLTEEVDMQCEICAFIQKRARGQEIDEKLRAKITNALIRRGHSYEAISSAFRQIKEDAACPDE